MGSAKRSTDRRYHQVVGTESYVDIAGEYDVVSTDCLCGLGEGQIPYQCWQPLSDVASCQNECTALDTCVAYGEGTSYAVSPTQWQLNDVDICVIYPNVRECPTGWNNTAPDNPAAYSANDLRITSIGSSFCRAKRGIDCIKGQSIF